MTVDEQPAAATLQPSAAPATLFIPGLHGTAAQWEALTTRLPQDRPALTAELPGIGGPDDGGPYSLAAVSEQLATLVEGQSSGPVDVVGHGWGATLGIALAAIRPELVRYLVVISGAWPPGLAAGPDRPAPKLSWAARLLAGRPTRGDRKAVLRVRREYVRNAGAISGTPKPARSLVIWGARDRVLRPRYGEKVVSALGRFVDPATVEMVTFPGVGSAPHVTAAAAVAPLLCDFLRAS